MKVHGLLLIRGASSSIHNSEARISIESTDMIYTTLDCDDEMFTARVYKETTDPNSRRKSSKSRDEPARDDQELLQAT